MSTSDRSILLSGYNLVHSIFGGFIRFEEDPVSDESLIRNIAIMGDCQFLHATFSRASGVQQYYAQLATRIYHCNKPGPVWGPLLFLNI